MRLVEHEPFEEVHCLREAAMTRAICRAIWLASEACGVPLGCFAPWVFGGIVGAWPVALQEDDHG